MLGDSLLRLLALRVNVAKCYDFAQSSALKVLDDLSSAVGDAHASQFYLRHLGNCFLFLLFPVCQLRELFGGVGCRTCQKDACCSGAHRFQKASS